MGPCETKPTEPMVPAGSTYAMASTLWGPSSPQVEKSLVRGDSNGHIVALPIQHAHLAGGSKTQGILEIGSAVAFGWRKLDAPADVNQASLDRVVAQFVLDDVNVGNRSAGLDHETENDPA